MRIILNALPYFTKDSLFMKKVLIIGVALLMLVAVTACGNKPVEESSVSEIESSIEESSIAESSEESSAADTSTATGQSAVTSTAAASTGGGTTSSDVAWKVFIKDYTALVDRLLAVVDKQKANPTDMSVLTELTSILNEVSSFTDAARIAEIQASIGNDKAALAEFQAALEVQIKRLTDATASMQ